MRHRREDVAPRPPRPRRRTRARSATRPPACAPTPASACSCPTRSPAAPCGRAAPAARRSAATRPGCSAASRERIAAPGGGAPPDPRRPSGAGGGDGRAARRRGARRRPRQRRRPTSASLGGGPMGLMLAALLRRPGAHRDARRPAPRAPRAGGANSARTRRGEPRRQHELVFEAVGRPEAWRAAVAAAAPGGRRGTRRRLPARDRRHPATRPAPLRRARAPRALPPRAGRGRSRAGRAGRRHCPVADAARTDDLARASSRTRSAAPERGPRDQVGGGSAALAAARRYARCSTIRRESQIASPSITSTGTRR